MRQALRPHPGSGRGAVSGLEAQAVRQGGRGLALRYRVSGDVGRIILPPAAAASGASLAASTEGLWRATCFEAFIAARPEGPYYELNLAPSGAWAAYRFEAYREGMAEVAGFPPPRIAVRSDERALELQADLALDLLADLPADAPWRLGLSAVIEDVEGAMAYWALAHPEGRPDFHHPISFAAELPPERRP